MQSGYSIGLVSALIAGAVLAVVSALEGYISKHIGAANATMVEHVTAGVISAVAVIFFFRRGSIQVKDLENLWPQIIIAASLVLVGVGAIAYAIPRTGLAVGNFGIVIAQVITAVIIDAVGFGDLESIPITLPRILGLALMIAGLYVILPRN